MFVPAGYFLLGGLYGLLIAPLESMGMMLKMVAMPAMVFTVLAFAAFKAVGLGGQGPHKRWDRRDGLLD